ncbi:fimbrial biogenesis chaperone [Proteus myxofaciens]|uniref:Periplasmic fimbrial chaperone n=1 Tax=Proteus myxofaciens ATCC 19692 TaxID=1354337 RepID=A0A198FP05_9GAMM|nr:molecular chaperone [Proteus myxofaciens]OAT26500.1 periplasmic fimbrial chaperone [Proteus myxofaciens ATCC 19692]
MKLKMYTAILLLLSSLNVFAVQNIALDKTRIIYMPKEKNVITVYNKSESPFLVQAKIKFNKNNNVSENSLEPGIAIPPLFRVEPDNKFTTQIMINGDKLPDDRESLLHLYILSIPSLEKKEEENKNNSISIASESVLKVFYRPSQIDKKDEDDVLNNLSFKYKDNNLIIENTSPYYITFSKIILDKEKIALDYDNSMISPFSSMKYHTKYASTKIMSLSVISDNGDVKNKEYKNEIK